MSLKPNSEKEIPAETVKVAKAAFVKGNIYIKMRDELGAIYEDEKFAALFSDTGRPAESPGRLALVTIFQFVESLSDRAAADGVRGRIDWKYALGLELKDKGFDASVLTEFRARLVENEQAQIIFNILIEKLKQIKLVKGGGKQRTDSTTVIAKIHSLSRLECVSEAMRLALNSISVIDAQWMLKITKGEWFERYEKRLEDFNFNEIERKKLKLQIGEDGYYLLTEIYNKDTAQYLRVLPAIDLLRRIWIQHYYVDNGELKWRESSNFPPSREMICSPYDEDARFSYKREVKWQGYKVHLTETIEEELPNLIVDVKTTTAPATDKEVLPDIQEKLQERNLLPASQLVDGGYTTAGHIVNSQQNYGINLIGPVMETPGWQVRAGKGFDISAFTIDWDNKQAICPNGKINGSWQESKADYGMDIVYIYFKKSDCSVCPHLLDCTNCKTQRRTITVNARPYHEALVQARARQKTDQFKQEYKARAGIEGTISQATRAMHIKQARYKGLPKVELQHFATAAAINLVRLGAWWLGHPREKTRLSHFQKLKHLAA